MQSLAYVGRARQFQVFLTTSFFLLFLLAGCSKASSVAQQTNPASITQNVQVRAPRPTRRARTLGVLQNDLKALGVRKDSAATCGYLDGISTPAAPLVCEAGTECALNDYYRVEGCCPANDFDNCVLPMKCVPYTKLASCDSACQKNRFILKCTEKSFGECVTGDYIEATGTYSFVDCNTVAARITVYNWYVNGASTVTVAKPIPATVTITSQMDGDDSSKPAAAPTPTKTSERTDSPNVATTKKPDSSDGPPKGQDRLPLGAKIIVGVVILLLC